MSGRRGWGGGGRGQPGGRRQDFGSKPPCTQDRDDGSCRKINKPTTRNRMYEQLMQSCDRNIFHARGGYIGSSRWYLIAPFCQQVGVSSCCRLIGQHHFQASGRHKGRNYSPTSLRMILLAVPLGRDISGRVVSWKLRTTLPAEEERNDGPSGSESRRVWNSRSP